MITHHHSIGRDHMRWATTTTTTQHPTLFSTTCCAIKQFFDPHNICNPGVLYNATQHTTSKL